MEKMRICFLFMFALIFMMTTPSSWAQAPTGESAEGVLVGRIADIEGQLLRYVPEDKDWVATVKDVPFGLTDSLYSEAKAKPELLMPNNTWIRIGGNTQIQLITLQPDQLWSKRTEVGGESVPPPGLRNRCVSRPKPTCAHTDLIPRQLMFAEEPLP